jgi:hypothetical protein
MPDHLNLYSPYQRKNAGHEDALTRAFLIVLRGVPVAHAAWLHLVDQAHRANQGGGVPQLHSLPTPRVYMQTAQVPDGVKKVISLVQTDEEVFRESDAMSSDRRQVLDGVVGYNELAIVIENKPSHRDIWEGQLDVNVPTGVEHDSRIATVTWESIVTAWGRLLEAGHLGIAEALLLGDFLDYVEEHFPRLRPYSKVGLCGTDNWRLTRRCKAILTAIGGEKHVAYHRGWGWYLDLPGGLSARKIGLFADVRGDEPTLVLEIDPGDTMGQARIMYRSVQIEDVLALVEREQWAGWPNFHLMFMTSGFFHVGPAHVHLADYWRLWTTNKDLLRRWKREEFDAAFVALQSHGIVTQAQRADFDSQTVETKRGNIIFAPGLTFRWRLPIDEAGILDERNRLEDEVADSIRTACQVLKLRLHDTGPADS